MGAIKVDIEMDGRTYAVKYSLNDGAGVKKLLRDRHYIGEARFHGSTPASDILIDLHSAINSAGLTERQAEAVALVSGFDLTQKDAADVMGITRQAVAKMYDEAAEKIAAVYRKWDYEEFTVEYPLDDEDETEAA